MLPRMKATILPPVFALPLAALPFLAAVTCVRPNPSDSPTYGVLTVGTPLLPYYRSHAC